MKKQIYSYKRTILLFLFICQNAFSEEGCTDVSGCSQITNHNNDHITNNLNGRNHEELVSNEGILTQPDQGTETKLFLAGTDEKIYKIITEMFHASKNVDKQIEVYFYIYKKKEFTYITNLSTNLTVLKSVLLKYPHYFYNNIPNDWYINNLVMVPKRYGKRYQVGFDEDDQNNLNNVNYITNGYSDFNPIQNKQYLKNTIPVNKVENDVNSDNSLTNNENYINYWERRNNALPYKKHFKREYTGDLQPDNKDHINDNEGTYKSNDLDLQNNLNDGYTNIQSQDNTDNIDLNKVHTKYGIQGFDTIHPNVNQKDFYEFNIPDGKPLKGKDITVDILNRELENNEIPPSQSDVNIPIGQDYNVNKNVDKISGQSWDWRTMNPWQAGFIRYPNYSGYYTPSQKYNFGSDNNLRDNEIKGRTLVCKKNVYTPTQLNYPFNVNMLQRNIGIEPILYGPNVLKRNNIPESESYKMDQRNSNIKDEDVDLNQVENSNGLPCHNANLLNTDLKLKDIRNEMPYYLTDRFINPFKPCYDYNTRIWLHNILQRQAAGPLSNYLLKQPRPSIQLTVPVSTGENMLNIPWIPGPIQGNKYPYDFQTKSVQERYPASVCQNPYISAPPSLPPKICPNNPNIIGYRQTVVIDEFYPCHKKQLGKDISLKLPQSTLNNIVDISPQDSYSTQQNLPIRFVYPSISYSPGKPLGPIEISPQLSIDNYPNIHVGPKLVEKQFNPQIYPTQQNIPTLSYHTIPYSSKPLSPVDSMPQVPMSGPDVDESQIQPQTYYPSHQKTPLDLSYTRIPYSGKPLDSVDIPRPIPSAYPTISYYPDKIISPVDITRQIPVSYPHTDVGYVPIDNQIKPITQQKTPLEISSLKIPYSAKAIPVDITQIPIDETSPSINVGPELDKNQINPEIFYPTQQNLPLQLSYLHIPYSKPLGPKIYSYPTISYPPKKILGLIAITQETPTYPKNVSPEDENVLKPLNLPAYQKIPINRPYHRILYSKPLHSVNISPQTPTIYPYQNVSPEIDENQLNPQAYSTPKQQRTPIKVSYLQIPYTEQQLSPYKITPENTQDTKPDVIPELDENRSSQTFPIYQKLPIKSTYLKIPYKSLRPYNISPNPTTFLYPTTSYSPSKVLGPVDITRPKTPNFYPSLDVTTRPLDQYELQPETYPELQNLPIKSPYIRIPYIGKPLGPVEAPTPEIFSYPYITYSPKEFLDPIDLTQTPTDDTNLDQELDKKQFYPETYRTKYNLPTILYPTASNYPIKYLSPVNNAPSIPSDITYPNTNVGTELDEIPIQKTPLKLSPIRIPYSEKPLDPFNSKPAPIKFSYPTTSYSSNKILGPDDIMHQMPTEVTYPYIESAKPNSNQFNPQTLSKYEKSPKKLSYIRIPYADKSASSDATSIKVSYPSISPLKYYSPVVTIPQVPAYNVYPEITDMRPDVNKLRPKTYIQPILPVKMSYTGIPYAPIEYASPAATTPKTPIDYSYPQTNFSPETDNNQIDPQTYYPIQQNLPIKLTYQLKPYYQKPLDQVGVTPAPKTLPDPLISYSPRKILGPVNIIPQISTEAKTPIINVGPEQIQGQLIPETYPIQQKLPITFSPLTIPYSSRPVNPVYITPQSSTDITNPDENIGRLPIENEISPQIYPPEHNLPTKLTYPGISNAPIDYASPVATTPQTPIDYTYPQINVGPEQDENRISPQTYYPAHQKLPITSSSLRIPYSSRPLSPYYITPQSPTDITNPDKNTVLFPFENVKSPQIYLSEHNLPTKLSEYASPITTTPQTPTDYSYPQTNYSPETDKNQIEPQIYYPTQQNLPTKLTYLRIPYSKIPLEQVGVTPTPKTFPDPSISYSPSKTLGPINIIPQISTEDKNPIINVGPEQIQGQLIPGTYPTQQKLPITFSPLRIPYATRPFNPVYITPQSSTDITNPDENIAPMPFENVKSPQIYPPVQNLPTKSSYPGVSYAPIKYASPVATTPQTPIDYTYPKTNIGPEQDENRISPQTYYTTHQKLPITSSSLRIPYSSRPLYPVYISPQSPADITNPDENVGPLPIKHEISPQVYPPEQNLPTKLSYAPIEYVSPVATTPQIPIDYTYLNTNVGPMPVESQIRPQNYPTQQNLLIPYSKIPIDEVGVTSTPTTLSYPYISYSPSKTLGPVNIVPQISTEDKTPIINVGPELIQGQLIPEIYPTQQKLPITFSPPTIPYSSRPVNSVYITPQSPTVITNPFKNTGSLPIENEISPQIYPAKHNLPIKLSYPGISYAPREYASPAVTTPQTAIDYTYPQKNVGQLPVENQIRPQNYPTQQNLLIPYSKIPIDEVGVTSTPTTLSYPYISYSPSKTLGPINIMPQISTENKIPIINVEPEKVQKSYSIQQRLPANLSYLKIPFSGKPLVYDESTPQSPTDMTYPSENTQSYSSYQKTPSKSYFNIPYGKPLGPVRIAPTPIKFSYPTISYIPNNFISPVDITSQISPDYSFPNTDVGSVPIDKELGPQSTQQKTPLEISYPRIPYSSKPLIPVDFTPEISTESSVKEVATTPSKNVYPEVDQNQINPQNIYPTYQKSPLKISHFRIPFSAKPLNTVDNTPQISTDDISPSTNGPELDEKPKLPIKSSDFIIPYSPPSLGLDIKPTPITISYPSVSYVPSKTLGPIDITPQLPTDNTYPKSVPRPETNQNQPQSLPKKVSYLRIPGKPLDLGNISPLSSSYPTIHSPIKFLGPYNLPQVPTENTYPEINIDTKPDQLPTQTYYPTQPNFPTEFTYPTVSYAPVKYVTPIDSTPQIIDGTPNIDTEPIDQNQLNQPIYPQKNSPVQFSYLRIPYVGKSLGPIDITRQIPTYNYPTIDVTSKPLDNQLSITPNVIKPPYSQSIRPQIVYQNAPSPKPLKPIYLGINPLDKQIQPDKSSITKPSYFVAPTKYIYTQKPYIGIDTTKSKPENNQLEADKPYTYKNKAIVYTKIPPEPENIKDINTKEYSNDIPYSSNPSPVDKNDIFNINNKPFYVPKIISNTGKYAPYPGYINIGKKSQFYTNNIVTPSITVAPFTQPSEPSHNLLLENKPSTQDFVSIPKYPYENIPSTISPVVFTYPQVTPEQALPIENISKLPINPWLTPLLKKLDLVPNQPYQNVPINEDSLNISPKLPSTTEYPFSEQTLPLLTKPTQKYIPEIYSTQPHISKFEPSYNILEANKMPLPSRGVYKHTASVYPTYDWIGAENPITKPSNVDTEDKINPYVISPTADRKYKPTPASFTYQIPQEIDTTKPNYLNLHTTPSPLAKTPFFNIELSPNSKSTTYKPDTFIPSSSNKTLEKILPQSLITPSTPTLTTAKPIYSLDSKYPTATNQPILPNIWSKSSPISNIIPQYKGLPIYFNLNKLLYPEENKLYDKPESTTFKTINIASDMTNYKPIEMIPESQQLFSPNLPYLSNNLLQPSYPYKSYNKPTYFKPDITNLYSVPKTPYYKINIANDMTNYKPDYTIIPESQNIPESYKNLPYSPSNLVLSPYDASTSKPDETSIYVKPETTHKFYESPKTPTYYKTNIESGITNNQPHYKIIPTRENPREDSNNLPYNTAKPSYTYNPSASTYFKPNSELYPKTPTYYKINIKSDMTPDDKITPESQNIPESYIQFSPNNILASPNIYKPYDQALKPDKVNKVYEYPLPSYTKINNPEYPRENIPYYPSNKSRNPFYAFISKPEEKSIYFKPSIGTPKIGTDSQPIILPPKSEYQVGVPIKYYIPTTPTYKPILETVTNPTSTTSRPPSDKHEAPDSLQTKPLSYITPSTEIPYKPIYPFYKPYSTDVLNKPVSPYFETYSKQYPIYYEPYSPEVSEKPTNSYFKPYTTKYPYKPLSYLKPYSKESPPLLYTPSFSHYKPYSTELPYKPIYTPSSPNYYPTYPENDKQLKLPEYLNGERRSGIPGEIIKDLLKDKLEEFIPNELPIEYFNDNFNNPYVDITDFKTIDLGNVNVAKYEPDKRKMLVKTANPNIDLVAWKSKVKVINAKLILDVKDVSAINFMPVLKENVNLNAVDVESVAKDIIEKYYGEPIVLKGQYSIYHPYSVIYNQGAERSSYYVLWPTFCGRGCLKSGCDCQYSN